MNKNLFLLLTILSLPVNSLILAEKSEDGSVDKTVASTTQEKIKDGVVVKKDEKTETTTTTQTHTADAKKDDKNTPPTPPKTPSTPTDWKKFFNSAAYNSVGLPLKALNYFDYLKDEKIGFKAVAAVTTTWAIVGGLAYFAYNKYQEQRMKQKEDQSLDNLMKQILDDQEMKNTQQTEEA